MFPKFRAFSWQGEKECPYYMRTGSCKYGSTCRFHHPEPTTVGGGDSPSGYGNDISLPSQHTSPPSLSSWSSHGPSHETSAYVPIAFTPTHQSVPTSHPHWNGHKVIGFSTQSSISYFYAALIFQVYISLWWFCLFPGSIIILISVVFLVMVTSLEPRHIRLSLHFICCILSNPWTSLLYHIIIEHNVQVKTSVFFNWIFF